MRNLAIILCILALGFVLRIYKVAERPLGFTWDEAALGYNAYSLLITGKDEYGEKLPVVLKSFGEYKPGLYAYLVVPSVGLLGLTEFATRLPSVLAGTMMILAGYFLAKALQGERVAMFTTFILAINPWSIHFSRGGWEANVAVLLATLGTVLFMRKRLLLAMLLFGLTFWTYQGAKMLTPLVLLGLFVVYRPTIRQLVKPIILLAVVLMPIVVGLGSQSGRLKVLSVFSYVQEAADIETIRTQDTVANSQLPFELYHSNVLDQLRGVAQRFFNHYSPNFLFISGDWSNPRHATPYYGNFHLVEIATMLTGVVLLVRRGGRGATFLAWWLVAATLPAAMSRDMISGVRSLPMAVGLAIVSGMGLAALSERKWLGRLLVVVLFGSLLYYLDLFYIHAPQLSGAHWLSAYKPAMSVVREQMDAYDKVVFTPLLGQPYIFALFYLQIDPEVYQQQSLLAENAQGDVGQVERFGKFEFRPIYWPDEKVAKSTLFVGSQYELPDSDPHPEPGTIRVTDVTHSDGSHAFRIFAKP